MQIDTPIQKLISLTREMHRQAKAGSWEQLLITDKKREQVLDHGLGNGSLKPVDAETMQQLQQLHNEILKLAAIERGQLTTSHRQSRSKIDASQQYLNLSARSAPSPLSIRSATDKEAN